MIKAALARDPRGQAELIHRIGQHARTYVLALGGLKVIELKSWIEPRAKRRAQVSDHFRAG